MINKRSIGLMIFNVDSCNPNGDPDWEGPRVYNNRLLVSPGSMKRKQRDLLVDHGSDHFRAIQELHGFNPEQFHVFESLSRGFDGTALETAKQALDLLKTDEVKFIQRYWDIRVFGTTSLEQKSKADAEDANESEEKPTKRKTAKSTKAQADGELARMKRQGPVSITPGKSICPVQVDHLSITKKAPLRDSHLANEQGDMAPGALKIVNHAVCVASVVVNPTVVRDLKTSDMDIEVMKTLLTYQFSSSASAARPANSVQMIHIWWADHTNPLGSFNEFKFVEALKPVRKGDPESPSATMADYHFPTPEEVGFDFEVTDLMERTLR